MERIPFVYVTTRSGSKCAIRRDQIVSFADGTFEGGHAICVTLFNAEVLYVNTDFMDFTAALEKSYEQSIRVEREEFERAMENYKTLGLKIEDDNGNPVAEYPILVED